MYITTYLKLCT